MESNIKNYKTYTIITEERERHGIFFRNPRQSIYFDAFYGMQDKSDYFTQIKNPIRRLYEIIIGNSKVVKNIDSWLQDLTFGGCNIWKLKCPIYFKRTERTLFAIDTSGECNIISVKSRGYESQWNSCSGECVVERTKIKLKNGKTIKHTNREQFHYTYSFKIQELIDGKSA